jgi:putative membrane protein
MGMGAADVVPGVSGGTIAIISGIYEELLNSISNVNLSLFKTLKNEGFKAAWQQLNGSFLLSLFIGVFISIISLAKAIKYLLENEPVLLWSFFFGLVLASIIYIAKQVTKWNFKNILLGVLGAVLGYLITVITSVNGQETSYLFLIFAGAIASCAMILPGISGSYILLLIGVYPTVMTALTDKDLRVLSAVTIGVVVGLITFSKFLKFLFSNYKNQMLIVLTGLMLGSLNKVWPWKATITTYLDRHGVVKPLLEESVSPFSFEGDSELTLAVVMAIVGFVLILLMERLAVKKH